MSLQDLLRQLPAVDAVLGCPEGQALTERFGRRAATSAARRAVDAARQSLRAGGSGAAEAPLVPTAEALAFVAREHLDAGDAGRLVDVINATGVLVHTNLGRAPLGASTIARLAARAAGQTNLEMDLETGRRGRRAEGCEDLLVEVSGSEAAFVVNNTAAALLLALNTFAADKAVIVSRGELVEIGGSFRLPAICERSGARLIEVGTTNRTRVADFAEAIESNGTGPGGVGLILKMHPSNFRIVGFTEEASLEQLVALGRRHDVPVVMDQGSGALEDLSPWGVVGEPPVPGIVEAGADLVLFSGDKLLGGPQAGCAVGRRAAVDACRKNPLYRALRVGRLVATALESTLWAHATQRVDDLPVLAQLRQDVALVGERARRLRDDIVAGLGSAEAIAVDVAEDASTSGGGSSPSARIPTFVVRVSAGALGVEALSARLRASRPALIGRITDDRFLLDLRTIPPERDAEVARLLIAAMHSS